MAIFRVDREKEEDMKILNHNTEKREIEVFGRTPKKVKVFAQKWIDMHVTKKGEIGLVFGIQSNGAGKFIVEYSVIPHDFY